LGKYLKVPDLLHRIDPEVVDFKLFEEDFAVTEISPISSRVSFFSLLAEPTTATWRI
jgi:hypothetical protein